MGGEGLKWFPNPCAACSSHAGGTTISCLKSRLWRDAPRRRSLLFKRSAQRFALLSTFSLGPKWSVAFADYDLCLLPQVTLLA